LTCAIRAFQEDRLEREGLLFFEDAGEVGLFGGPQAVKADADPGQVEFRFREKDGRSGAGHVLERDLEAARRELPAHRPVAFELTAGIIVLRRVLDVGEMGGKALDDEPGVLPDVPDERPDVLDVDALSPRPGLHFDMQANRLAETGGQSGQASDRLPVIYGQAQVPGHGLLQAEEGHVADDQDGGLDASLPERHAFLHGMDAEPIDAAPQGDPRDLEEPMAVSVGFDHGQELPLPADDAAEFADVVDEGRLLDLDAFDQGSGHPLPS
jgi:hypothetical protein